MEQFSSGWKQNYYGKGDVIVYRLEPDGRTPVFGASVKMLAYGDAFWRTYTEGDNTGLIATDSMKNFIQREALHFKGSDLEGYCHFLSDKFIAKYPQVEGVQVSAVEIPWSATTGHPQAFTPVGPERLTARIEMGREGLLEAASGIVGFRLLRLGGSAFKGFVRDEYTTLPEIANRPLHMWLDLEWLYAKPDDALNTGATANAVRRIVHAVFGEFESGSIQQVIYRIGTRMLEEIAEIREIHLEANNRTWDMVADGGEGLGVFTDARPPYGCLGLRLKR